MKLSIVIPAHNEEGSIEATVRALHQELKNEAITHEILIVNDNSKDSTADIVSDLQREILEVKLVHNTPPHGFGFAVRKGLESFSGDVVGIVMADASDNPKDVVSFYRQIEKGFDCAFGTRWVAGAHVIDYPLHKKILNRLANFFIRSLFGFRYNDVTNAFKMYKKEVISGVQPILSHHFNLTVEIPLKAIIRGFSYSVLPNDWINRKAGVSKLKIKEMGSRYLFIVLYCLLEKWLSRGDYYRPKEKTANLLPKSLSPSFEEK